MQQCPAQHQSLGDKHVGKQGQQGKAKGGTCNVRPPLRPQRTHKEGFQTAPSEKRPSALSGWRLCPCWS
eukprot:scaffold81841_cov28-Prasinocladus_malaysianus.AAC.1